MTKSQWGIDRKKLPNTKIGTRFLFYLKWMHRFLRMHIWCFLFFKDLEVYFRYFEKWTEGFKFRMCFCNMILLALTNFPADGTCSFVVATLKWYFRNPKKILNFFLCKENNQIINSILKNTWFDYLSNLFAFFSIKEALY